MRNVAILNKQCKTYRVAINKAKAHLDRVTNDLCVFTPLLLRQKELVRTMLDMAKESVRCVLALYSMPQKNKLMNSGTGSNSRTSSSGRDTRRRLQRIDPSLVYIRDPLQRSHRIYRSGWGLVDRRFKSLRKQSGSENINNLKILFENDMKPPARGDGSDGVEGLDGSDGHSDTKNIVKNNILKNFDDGTLKLSTNSAVTATISASAKVDSTLAAAIRSVVEIYNDPVTDYIILSIGQQTATVEESSLHDDFQLNKLDFSDLTSDVEYNEILLKPFDVDFMLKRSPQWPAEMMKPKVAVGSGSGLGGNEKEVGMVPHQTLYQYLYQYLTLIVIVIM